jgi:hypothetical protein
LTTTRTATVTVSATGVTQQTVAITQDMKTGTSIIQIEEFSVYPNPFSDGFNVSIGDKAAYVSVFDSKGVLILKTRIYGNQFIPAGWLTNGIYVVELAEGQSLVRKKLIKR